jgi:hypothetical protein
LGPELVIPTGLWRPRLMVHARAAGST